MDTSKHSQASAQWVTKMNIDAFSDSPSNPTQVRWLFLPNMYRISKWRFHIFKYIGGPKQSVPNCWLFPIYTLSCVFALKNTIKWPLCDHYSCAIHSCHIWAPTVYYLIWQKQFLVVELHWPVRHDGRAEPSEVGVQNLTLSWNFETWTMEALYPPWPPCETSTEVCQTLLRSALRLDAVLVPSWCELHFLQPAGW